MVCFLKREHFEPLLAQMECKEHGKITLKDVSELTDVPTYKSMTRMPQHIRDFESYLVTHYDVEGFPLDYVIRPKLASAYWHTLKPRGQMGNENAFP